MITRLALRNLKRNRWRTALTMGGIAVATTLMVWMVCLIDGMTEMMIRGATAVEMGQVQIHDQDYAERASIYQHMVYDEEVLNRIEDVDMVESASPRVRVFGLLGHERSSQVINLVGVDPTREAATSLIDDALIDGRWLSQQPEEYPAPREVVLGERFAQQIDVSVGDELAMFVFATNGSLGNDALQVVGIVRTGAEMVDRMTGFMTLDDIQYAAALEGRVHEIAVSVSDYTRTPELVGHIALATGEQLPTIQVRPWQAIIPDLAKALDMNDKSIWVSFFIVYFVVVLGIVNTQRMSALERRREFGVLLAIGLKPKWMRRMLMAETVLLTFIGAAIGAGLGLALSLYHAHHGFDLTAMSSTGDSFTWMGVSFEERMKFVVTPGAVWKPVISVLAMASVVGLWPAIKSGRLNATQAISGRS